MLIKHPNTTRRRGGIVLGGFLAFEGVLLLGSAYWYFKMVDSQEYRKKIFNRWPKVSNVFYMTCDYSGSKKWKNLRKDDYAAWGVRDPLGRW